MRYLLIPSLLLLALIGCKSTPINQKINKKREGLWIENYAVDSAKYQSVGKYHLDDPVKKWRYYLNGKIIKREKYKHNICNTKNYFENGKIQSKGHTKTTTNNIEIHWFYDGKWFFFDENGKLTLIRNYANGELVSEVEFNHK